MRSSRRLYHPILIVIFFVSLISCKTLPGSGVSLDVSSPTNVAGLADAFLKYYQPVPEDYTVNMPAYSLPLDVTRVTNWNQVAGLYLDQPRARELLKKNGFVVIPRPGVDDIAQPYEWLRDQEIPIYVTADTPLHLFHIQFDETLKDIEESVFSADMLAVTKVLLETSKNDYATLAGDLKEAARRNVAYFSIALRQFEPDFVPPGYVKAGVDWECKKIEAHEGLPDYETARKEALFRIPEDYSQYLPRGHYTRSDILKKYFRAMMWYGRMTFLLKGSDNFGAIIPPAEALTDRTTAKIQTLEACLIAARVVQLKLPDGRSVADAWNRLYAVTAFYAGFADDLTPYDYREALQKIFGSAFNARDLLGEDKFAQFAFALALLKPPAIFSGTGGAGIDPGGAAGHRFTSIAQLDKILNYTMGFRLLGQRYIPDSYILGQLVSPGAGSIPKIIPPRFTVVYVPDERIQPDLAYSIRGYPRGLDVFSVFGSKRAEQILADSLDDDYPGYRGRRDTLRQEFAKLGSRDWNRNLYWSWLYALKTLTETRGNGYQTYQRSDAWLDRQLTTALASWSALRHNTILYAKQSYTPEFVGITSVQPTPPPPPPPKGLVEPLPAFYARILATAKMAYAGLKNLNVLDDKSEARLTSLIATLETLYGIVQRQVANQPLTAADNNFLAGFPAALKQAIGDVDDQGLKTTLITDVHTCLNEKKCLEEASGYVDYLIVAYRRAEGDIVLAVGPVLSYYEFKQPITDRLTDEKWREILNTGGAPIRPAWIGSYY
jgi:hypothetical protein